VVVDSPVYGSPAEAFVQEFTGGNEQYHAIDLSVAYLNEAGAGRMIDVNGDSINECLITTHHLITPAGERDSIMGATGNGSAYLLRQASGGWVVIARLGGIGKYDWGEHRVEGWPDIGTCHDGGRVSTNDLYRWNGLRYEVVESTTYDTPGH